MDQGLHLPQYKKFSFWHIVVGLSRFVSSALSPLLIPTYSVFLALWVSYLCSLPVSTRMGVLLVVLGITCVLPIIAVALLHNLKIIKNKRLERREERLIPYAVSVLCYVAFASYLHHVHTPDWLVMYAWGVMASSVVSLLINLRWKIGAHATGMGGLVALLVMIHYQDLEAFNLLWVICAAILLSGLLGTARIVMNRHTCAQVLLGFCNGFSCVYLLMRFFS